MKYLKIKALLFVTFFFISSVSYAEASADSVDKILDLSGIVVQVNEFPGQIKMGMEQAQQQGAPIPEDEFTAMMTMVDLTIIPSDMLLGMRSSIQESMSEQEVQELLVWYESAVGKEITAAEERLASAEGFQTMMEAGESLLDDTARVDYAKRLNELLGITDITLDLQESTGLAVFTGIMTSMQPHEQPDLEAFQAQMAAMREQSYKAMEKMIMMSLVYSYQPVEMAKLEQYEDFLKTPNAMKFNKNAMNSMSNEIVNSTSKFAEGLSALLNKDETDA